MRKHIYLGVLSTLTWLSCIAGFYAPSAYAEGSQDLINSGGDRPYLEDRQDTNAGVLRSTTIKVYVNAGETIDLGSSAVGKGIGVINYRRANNTTGSCGANGLIPDRAAELAGPRAGFTPCIVTVGSGQSGVWEIKFVSPNPNKTTGQNTNPAPIAGTANWLQSSDIGTISAWDVTVRTSGGTPISGRVYANYYALNMGANGRSLSSSLYVLTREGYQYSVDLNGLDPFGFLLFANRSGFFDSNSAIPGNSIYRSLQFTGPNPGGLPPGYGFQNPNAPDTDVFVTHKTFINLPDSSMPTTANTPSGSTWLYRPPVPPPIPSNLAFVGAEGTSGQAGTSTPNGNGDPVGFITFNSTSRNAYSITIDLNSSGTFGDGNDRTFVGRSVIGENSVPWDGLDGNGDIIPANGISYSLRMNQYGGEAHFPLIDPEQNPQGIKIRRLNQPAGATSLSDNPNNVYYNDTNTGGDYTLCAAQEATTNSGVAAPICYGGPPTPRQALSGINSSSGAHAFSSLFGDRRGIDTWVYYPSTDVALADSITFKEADLIVNKTVDLDVAGPGDRLTYTITVKNDGPSDSPGARFEDTVPSELSNVSWRCEMTEGDGLCNEESGSGNAISTTLDLNNQAIATYTVTGTLGLTTSGTVTNSASVARNKDITDPNLDNNDDDAVTTVRELALKLVKRVTSVGGTRITAVKDNPNDIEDDSPDWPDDYLQGDFDTAAQPDQTVEYTIYFLSDGSAPISNVQICDLIPENTAYVAGSLQLSQGLSLAQNLTDAADADAGELFGTVATPPGPCDRGTNTDGGILVRVPGSLPNAVSSGNPETSYGFVRFSVLID